MTRNEVIEILKEDREKVIKQISFSFRKILPYYNMTLADAMNYVIDFCVESNALINGWKAAVIKASNKLHREKEAEWNIKTYGIANPTIADMMAKNDNDNNVRYNVATKRYENL